MSEPSYILAAVGVAAGITWALRALPFAVLAPLQESRLLPYICLLYTSPSPRD